MFLVAVKSAIHSLAYDIYIGIFTGYLSPARYSPDVLKSCIVCAKLLDNIECFYCYSMFNRKWL